MTYDPPVGRIARNVIKDKIGHPYRFSEECVKDHMRDFGCKNLIRTKKIQFSLFLFIQLDLQFHFLITECITWLMLITFFTVHATLNIFSESIDFKTESWSNLSQSNSVLCDGLVN